MKNFLAEFKTFALRGNVADLAIAFVMGTAFSKIVSSVVDNLLTPAISLSLGVGTLSRLTFKVVQTTIQYGVFLQSVLDFLLIAFTIFLLIKLVNRLVKKNDAEPQISATPSEDTLLLREIRDVLKKSK